MKMMWLGLLLLCTIKSSSGSELDALLNGDVSLKAENGNLWSYVNLGYKENIEALKKSEVDKLSLFTFEKVDENHVYIKSKQNGKYLSRINRGIDFIEPAKAQPDAYCKFKVTFLKENVVLFQADTGKYLSRVWRNGKNNIEPYKNTIDPYCKFTFEKSGSQMNDYESNEIPQYDDMSSGGWVMFGCDDGNFWSVTSGRGRVQATEEDSDLSRFKITDAHDGHVFISDFEDRYLYVSDTKIQHLRAEHSAVDPNARDEFLPGLRDDGKYTFVSQGKYLCRVSRGGHQNIEARKMSEDDQRCHFIVIIE